MNPLDFFLMEKKAASSGRIKRAKEDLELWQRWDQNGRKSEDLDVLMQHLEPLIRKQSGVYSGKVGIPKPAIHAEFQLQTIKALPKYDPNRAALGTFLTNEMKKSKRYIATYQNTGRIPETRIYKIKDFEVARDELADELQREPSAIELADRLKWPVNQVSTMEKELRRTVPLSSLQGGLAEVRSSKEAETLRLLQYDLSPEEHIVFEYLLGENGKPKLTPSQIAVKLNMSQSKISRIKTNIGKKAKGYL